MTSNDGFGLFLILLSVALAFGVLFLISKRKSKGILGNRFLLFGAMAALLIILFAAKDTIVSYYQQMFKPSPYDFSEFKSIVFKYGEGDSLVNQYNSATGEYQYLNKQNELVKTRLYLTRNDLLYLHRKAAELGFWDFPSKELNTDTTNTNGVKPIEYFIELDYQHKIKTVVFSSRYEGSTQLVDANRLLIKEIESVISEAGDRQKK
ncbi:MAG TPA: hypothetical protein VFE53_15570 [Mucilaginibacter sp.]|jgi:hypothetical protein|nr:hypothetical protein [Mucilaginibacter sp.]